jgi:hypothetical protein
MDKVKEQLYEALRDIRENNAGSNERARGWYNAPAALAAYEQAKAAEPRVCATCEYGKVYTHGERVEQEICIECSIGANLGDHWQPKEQA